jgi:hypothetical protein
LPGIAALDKVRRALVLFLLLSLWVHWKRYQVFFYITKLMLLSVCVCLYNQCIMHDINLISSSQHFQEPDILIHLACQQICAYLYN